MLPRHVLVPFLSLFLVAAGCGSSGDSSDSGFVEEPGAGGASGGGGAGGKGGKAGSSSSGGSSGKGGSAGEGGSSSQGGQGGSSAQAGQAGQGSGGLAGAAGQAGGSGQGGSQAGAAGAAGGAGGAGSAGEGGGGQGGGTVEPCPQPPACDAPAPDPGPKRDWNHSIESPIIVATGSANHRGRDLFINPGADQWIIGKFAYGLSDKDLKEEEVDIYLLRDCGSSWEKLGTAVTTAESAHPTVEGVDDSGGRVYFQIPADKALGPGRHRVHMVVAGDLSSTDLFIEVVPPGTPMFISDVDGTLTTSENVEFVDLLIGTIPDTHVDAPEALTLLAKKGYRPMYVTARPEFLVERTREFVSLHGFPPGIIHTTTGLTGALGGNASDYKTGELKMLADKGLVPTFAFGNTATDAQAYENGKIQPPMNRIFYQFTDDKFGGAYINEYTELLPKFMSLPQVCGAPPM